MFTHNIHFLWFVSSSFVLLDKSIAQRKISIILCASGLIIIFLCYSLSFSSWLGVSNGRHFERQNKCFRQSWIYIYCIHTEKNKTNSCTSLESDNLHTTKKRRFVKKSKLDERKFPSGRTHFWKAVCLRQTGHWNTFVVDQFVMMRISHFTVHK